MTWNTHLTVGLNSLWLLTMFGSVDPKIFALAIPAAALASILPDIDAGGAKIHFIGGGTLRMFAGSFQGKYFHHRGLMHSLLAVFLVLLLVLLISRNLALALVTAAAYLSHPVIDGFNTGVGYLYPFSLKRFPLLPRKLCTRVNGPVDKLLFILGAFGVAVLLLLVIPNILFPRSSILY